MAKPLKIVRLHRGEYVINGWRVRQIHQGQWLILASDGQIMFRAGKLADCKSEIASWIRRASREVEDHA